MYLAIYVCKANSIIIHKNKSANAGACKAFRCIGANTAYAENSYPAYAKFFNPRTAE